MNTQETLVVLPYYEQASKAEPWATITRPNRKMCIAVAKAHYSGRNWAWYWVQADKSLKPAVAAHL